MSWVIRRRLDRKFVALPGCKYAYTADIAKAARYRTKRAAEHAACGNEYIESL